MKSHEDVNEEGIKKGMQMVITIAENMAGSFNLEVLLKRYHAHGVTTEKTKQTFPNLLSLFATTLDDCAQQKIKGEVIFKTSEYNEDKNSSL